MPTYRKIYWTDGSNSKPNGVGIMGFACTQGPRESERYAYCGTRHCTNQRAELKAIALAAADTPVEQRSEVILELHTDSAWSINALCLMLRLPSNYRKVKTHDEEGNWLPTYRTLYETADLLAGYREVCFKQVKGHTTPADVANGIISALDSERNNRCDVLANLARTVGDAEGILDEVEALPTE